MLHPPLRRFSPTLLALSAACGGAPFSSAGLYSASDSGTESSTDSPQLPPCACAQDLSNVGLGDFTIALTATLTSLPTAPGYFPLASQRRTCDAGNPGWEISVTSDGRLAVQVYDGDHVFDDAAAAFQLVDGAAHRVVVRRRLAGTEIDVGVDGAEQRFLRQAPEDLSGALAGMLSGVEPVCTLNAAAPSEPVAGVVTALCVARGDCEP
jgi:hypothetical protein